jgi:S-adenosylmethionine hydrolase
MRPVISLLSDFGLKDAYVAEMKAVILTICPDAQIVDVSHEIAKFDVLMGAFVLASAVPYFPKGTVHVAVVDPGVGTKRRPIVVETKRGLLVGPDNGLLMLAAKRESIKHVYAINNADFLLKHVSGTFHGRDIFAPVAAHLAMDRSPAEVGPKISGYVVPKYAKPNIKEKTVTGQVLRIDDFGNAITNISAKDLNQIDVKTGDSVRVELEKKTLRLKYCSAYGDVHPKKLLAVIGGHGFLEISVNRGNTARNLNAKLGISVRFSRI